MQSVLVVGDEICSTLRLWSVDIESRPECRYTLELTSGPDCKADAFFNHMVLQPAHDAVILANTKGKQIYIVHANQEGGAGLARFDFLSAFAVTQPILSLTSTADRSSGSGAGEDEGAFQVFTVQTEGVQQYTLFPDVCLPPIVEVDEAAGEEEGERTMAGVSSPPLLTPADVMQHIVGGEAGPPQEADGASDTASDAASPFRPDTFTGTGNHGATASRAAPPLMEHISGSAVVSEHGSSGSPPPSSSAFADARPAAAAATAGEGMRDHPMPPQPTMLVKRLSANALGSSASAFAVATEQQLVATKLTEDKVPPEEAAEAVDDEAEHESLPLGSQVDDEAAVAAAAVAAAASSLAVGTSGVGSGADLTRMLAMQQQLLAQLALSQRETVKQFKAELARSAKVWCVRMPLYERCGTAPVIWCLAEAPVLPESVTC